MIRSTYSDNAKLFPPSDAIGRAGRGRLVAVVRPCSGRNCGHGSDVGVGRKSGAHSADFAAARQIGANYRSNCCRSVRQSTMLPLAW